MAGDPWTADQVNDAIEAEFARRNPDHSPFSCAVWMRDRKPMVQLVMKLLDGLGLVVVARGGEETTDKSADEARKGTDS